MIVTPIHQVLVTVTVRVTANKMSLAIKKTRMVPLLFKLDQVDWLDHGNLPLYKFKIMNKGIVLQRLFIIDTALQA